ncbi:MAG: ABC-2 transporter permease [Bacteroidales bacterium]|nr:ABC-2 transporter permease [Clostridium sp.]MCM1204857.1 ABC-2 transporter permease [Bacteroidales bacterium]
MKGLFLDCIYKTIDNMKLLIGFLCIAGIGIITLIDSQSIVQIFIAVIFFSVSFCSLSVVRKDIKSGWYKYEVSLPVKKEMIVESKFWAYLFWLFISIILAVLFVASVIFLKGYKYFDLGMQDILTLFFVCISYALAVCAFFYLGLYIVGWDKNDALEIISVIFSVIFMVALVYLVNLAGISIESGRIILLVVSGFVFIMSLILSKEMYSKKEL